MPAIRGEPSKSSIYRNGLRHFAQVLEIAIAGVSVGFFGLMAFLTWHWGDGGWVALGLLAVGILTALVFPSFAPHRETPDYLAVQPEGSWAIYGNPVKGRRVYLSWGRVTKLEMAGDAFVQVRFDSPVRPGETLTFNLPKESYSTLVEFRTLATRAP